MEVHTKFSNFELGGIYVFSFLLCHIMRLSVSRGVGDGCFNPDFDLLRYMESMC